MTDELAEAKRHIRTLAQYLHWQIRDGADHHPTAPSAVRSAQAFLDREGQTVEGGEAMPSSRAELHDIIRREQDSIHALRRELGDKDVEIISLSTELTRLKAAQVEHDRTVRLAALDEVDQIAAGHEQGLPTSEYSQGWSDAARNIREAICALIDQTGGEGGI